MPRTPSRKAKWVADPDSDGGGKDDTLRGKDPLEELLKREATICKTQHYLHDPVTPESAQIHSRFDSRDRVKGGARLWTFAPPQ